MVIERYQQTRVRKIRAMVMVMLFGPWIWLCNYTRDAKKFWLSQAIYFASTIGITVFLTMPEVFDYQRGFVLVEALLPLFLFHDSLHSLLFPLVNEIIWRSDKFFIILFVWLTLWIWAIIDVVRKPMNRYAMEGSQTSKKIAMILSIVFGYMTWMYTYDKDRRKFWVSVGLIFGFLPAVMLMVWIMAPKGTDAGGSILMGLILFGVPILWGVVWVWPITDTVKSYKKRES